MPINPNFQSATTPQNIQGPQNIQDPQNIQSTATSTYSFEGLLNAQNLAETSANNILLTTAPTPREIIYRVEDTKKSQAMYVSETIAEQVEVGQVYIRSDQVAGPNITTLTADEILQLQPDNPQQYIAPTVGGGVVQTGPTTVTGTQTNFIGYLGSNTKFTFALRGFNDPSTGINVKYPVFSGPKPTTASAGAPTEILDNITSDGGIKIVTPGNYKFTMSAQFSNRKIWWKKGLWWGFGNRNSTNPDYFYMGMKIVRTNGNDTFVPIQSFAGTNGYIAKNLAITNAKNDNWDNLKVLQTLNFSAAVTYNNFDAGDIIKPFYVYVYGIGEGNDPKSITEVVSEENILPEFTSNDNYTYFKIEKVN